MKKQSKLSVNQWLMLNGGRSWLDLKKEKNGRKFVLMWNGIIHDYVKVYLPKHLQ